MSTMVCIYETLDPVDRHVVYNFLTSKGLETARLDPPSPHPEERRGKRLSIFVPVEREADARRTLLELIDLQKTARHSIRNAERKLLIAFFLAIAIGGGTGFLVWTISRSWGWTLEAALWPTFAFSLLTFGACFFLLEYGLKPRSRCGAQEQQISSPRSDEAPS